MVSGRAMIIPMIPRRVPQIDRERSIMAGLSPSDFPMILDVYKRQILRYMRDKIYALSCIITNSSSSFLYVRRITLPFSQIIADRSSPILMQI